MMPRGDIRKSAKAAAADVDRTLKNADNLMAHVLALVVAIRDGTKQLVTEGPSRQQLTEWAKNPSKPIALVTARLEDCIEVQ